MVVWSVGVVALLSIRFGVPLVDVEPPNLIWLALRRGTELWIAAGLVSIAVRNLSWRRMVNVIGPIRSTVLACLATLVVLAQFTNLWNNPYPFARWDMYGQRLDSTTYIELVMVADGVEIGPLPLTQIAPPREPRTVLARINALVTGSLGGSDDARRTLDATLEHLAGRVDEPTPDAIVIRRCVVWEPTAEAPVRCEIELTIDLDGVES